MIFEYLYFNHNLFKLKIFKEILPERNSRTFYSMLKGNKKEKLKAEYC